MGVVEGDEIRWGSEGAGIVEEGAEGLGVGLEVVGEEGPLEEG